MFKTMRYKIALITSAIVLIAGFSMTFGSSTAHALVLGNEYCIGTECLNAWNGGPYVNVENGFPLTNNYFTAANDTASGSWYIEDTDGGHWDGNCIGDWYNSPDYSNSSLDPCPSETSGGGWGTNWSYHSCDDGNGVAFKNNHTGGYLYPTGSANGDAFNNDGPYTCFVIQN